MVKRLSLQTSDGRLSRILNLLAAIAWLAIVPIAWLLNWLSSTTFISGASIYANFASHIAAWRADVDENKDQLDRIEEKLDRLLKEKE
jgi:aryl-alcohol dehydrogenase-like predicted oxidoreductase